MITVGRAVVSGGPPMIGRARPWTRGWERDVEARLGTVRGALDHLGRPVPLHQDRRRGPVARSGRVRPDPARGAPAAAPGRGPGAAARPGAGMAVVAAL